MDQQQFKLNIEKTFDKVANYYDKNLFFGLSAQRMIKLIPSKDTMRVLDLSTGTGAVAIELAKKFPHAEINAIDLSSGMLKQAELKAKTAGITTINFNQCDVDDLPYADEAFDVVTCGYGVFFYPDMESSFQKIFNLLKPKGFFVFSSFTPEAFNPYAKLFMERLAKDYDIEVPSGMRERLQTKSQIQELANTVKPTHIDVKEFPIRYDITVADWWALLNSAGYKSLIDELDEKQFIEFKQNHLNDILAFANNNKLELNVDSLFSIVQK